jgi:hypothetical protein
MAVLKGGSKSIHIPKKECLKELIVWLQEFIPPPTCFLVDGQLEIVGTTNLLPIP